MARWQPPKYLFLFFSLSLPLFCSTNYMCKHMLCLDIGFSNNFMSFQMKMDQWFTAPSLRLFRYIRLRKEVVQLSFKNLSWSCVQHNSLEWLVMKLKMHSQYFYINMSCQRHVAKKQLLHIQPARVSASLADAVKLWLFPGWLPKGLKMFTVS